MRNPDTSHNDKQESRHSTQENTEHRGDHRSGTYERRSDCTAPQTPTKSNTCAAKSDPSVVIGEMCLIPSQKSEDDAPIVDGNSISIEDTFTRDHIRKVTTIDDDDITLSYALDIDQLTFISGSLVDLGKTLEHNSRQGTFLFRNKISRIHNMKSSRQSFSTPTHSSIFYKNQKRSTLPLHALKNVKLFECCMHDITFSIYMVFFEVPVSGVINNNFTTNNTLTRIIQDLNRGMILTLEQMRDNDGDDVIDDDDHQMFSFMSSFAQAEEGQRRNATRPNSRVHRAVRTTRFKAPLAIKYFSSVMKIFSEGESNKQYKTAKFVMTACDLKHQIASQMIPIQGARNIDRDLNEAITSGASTMKARITELFPYYKNTDADMHLYFDYGISFKCTSAFNQRLTLLTKMDEIKNAIINSDKKTQTIIAFADDAGTEILLEDETSMESAEKRRSILLTAYMCVRTILKDVHTLHSDTSISISGFNFGPTLHHSLNSSSLFLASCKQFWCTDALEEGNQATSTFWFHFLTLTGRTIPDSGTDIDSNTRFHLAEYWHKAMAYTCQELSADPSTWWRLPIIFLELLLTCSTVRIDEDLDTSLKSFMSNTFSVSSHEAFLKSMNVFWNQIYRCRITIRRHSSHQTHDEMVTEMSGNIHTNVEEGEPPITFDQFYVEKSAKPNSGSCYSLFFLNEYGNFHTGNPVIKCSDWGLSVESKKSIPVELQHPTHHAGALGFQFYTSLIKAAIVRHNFNEWNLLPSLPVYI